MFGRSAVMGLRWYQPDGSAIVLAVLQRLGLIWNVRRPSPDAIAARRGRGAGATPSQRL
jgi:stearoyl-CoA desaturase (delta-9 desaturase)